MERTGLQETYRVFQNLRRYVASEAQLLEFLPAAIELEEQARRLSDGATDVPPLGATAAQNMPSRALAEEIVKIVSGLPPIGDDFDDATKLALAQLLTNLVAGVTGTIFSQFPEVIPHD